MSPVRRLILPVAAALAVLGSAAPALAHGDDRPRHGGQVQMTGEMLFELVNGPRGVDLYIIDDELPVQASSYAAKLVITTGAKKSEAALRAAGGNRFTSPGLRLPPGAKVGVTLINNASSARTFATFTVK